MKEAKVKTNVAVFICNYEKKGKETCAAKGSKELTDKLRKWAKEEHKGEIKIFRSGCLGKCSEGIAIACFPENKYILEVEPEDSKELKKIFESQLD